MRISYLKFKKDFYSEVKQTQANGGVLIWGEGFLWTVVSLNLYIGSHFKSLELFWVRILVIVSESICHYPHWKLNYRWKQMYIHGQSQNYILVNFILLVILIRFDWKRFIVVDD